MPATVYTVLVEDGPAPLVSAVFTDREQAVQCARKQIAKLQQQFTGAKFDDDDAGLFADNIVFSQSAPIEGYTGGEYLVGVIVQAIPVDQQP